jgi:hypothetical protein
MLCKIWGIHGSDYEECPLLGYRTPVCTSQETRYVSTTQASQLMLCNIWGIHGTDYEECRLLGYRTPVRTSQETHYVSATEPSRIMPFNIWGFQGGNSEEFRPLDIKTQFVPHRRQNTYPVQVLIRLILCKIWGFHGRNYRVKRFGELGTTLEVTSNRSALRYVPLKSRSLQPSHSVTSQKTAFFKVISVSVTYCLSIIPWNYKAEPYRACNSLHLCTRCRSPISFTPRPL